MAAVTGIASIAAASPAAAAESVLFPAPLHIQREVRDPVGDSVTRIDEYYHGNRAVSVRDQVTSIVDYAKGELTEIDRANGTYSLSRFDEIARAIAVFSPEPLRSVKEVTADRTDVEISAATPRMLAGRPADLIEVQSRAERLSAAVALDREILLSRDAFDVITGAAYPNRSHREHQLIAAAARKSAPVAMSVTHQQRNDEFRLPLEQTVHYELDGQKLQLRNTVIAVDAEMPSPDLLLIPHGARRVEGVWVQRVRMLEQLDK